jgi:hypothetical protein
MDADTEPTRHALSHRVGALVDVFEAIIYAIAFLLLVAAAVLVVIGGAEAVVQAVSHKVNTLQGGVLVLDRVLMALIIAEIAATLRAVFAVSRDRRGAFPFHWADRLRAADPDRDRGVRTGALRQGTRPPAVLAGRTGAAGDRDRGRDLHDSVQRASRVARRRVTGTTADLV